MYEVRRSTNGDENSIRQNFGLTADGGEVEYLTFPILEKTEIVKHLFTTRLGGVSQGDFSSMNLSFTRGDKESDVLANYGRIAELLSCGVGNMVASHQTHTTNIRHVTAADGGKGILRPRDYENIDGLITNEAGVVLVTYYADCVPLYFVHPVHRAIGLAHSGWRGTAAGMGARMVEAMGEAFGTLPKDVIAAVGPSICADCYEVSEDVAEQFMHLPNVVKKGKKEGKYQLNLWQANRLILQKVGVPAEQIAVTDVCTCCNSDYLFSHRVTGDRRGNLAAFLALR